MAWKQVRPFDLSKMGTRPGYCLQNVRLAFGVQSKYYDAKAAMLANKKAGTLHDISTLPKNVAVPVFVDTYSEYEHVEASDCGVFYSDGKRLTNPMNQKFFGWGETLNDERIVEFVEEPAPAPAPAPAPTPKPEPTPEPAKEGFKVGDVVAPTRLVDYNGTPLVQYDDTYTITQINGDRAVLCAPRNGKMVVWAAMRTSDIRRA
jgi:hypothetical protein